MKRLVFIVLPLFWSIGLNAQARIDYSEVDAIIEKYVPSDSIPGIIVGIVEGGSLIYARWSGMANLEYDLVLSDSSQFKVASISKEFTAACIGILIEEGLISLEDNIRDYLPELPDYSEPVLIKHLIYHTSGLADLVDIQFLSGLRNHSEMGNAEVMKMISAVKHLNHIPGSNFSYTNSGYVVLAEILETVTGQSLSEFARQRLFLPLGMTNTYFNDDYKKPRKNRVVGHRKISDEYQQMPRRAGTIGDGGLETNLIDLSKWNISYLETKLGYDDFDQYLKQGTLDSGQLIPYAFGFFVDDYRGYKMLDHGGRGTGFEIQIFEIIDKNTSVIVYANTENFPVRNVAFDVLDLFGYQDLTVPQTEKAVYAEPSSFIELSESTMSDLQGKYWNEDVGYSREIVYQDGRLFFKVDSEQMDTLKPIAKDQLYTAIFGANRIIKYGKDNKGDWISISINGKPERFLYKYQPVELDSIGLTPFSGSYYCEDLKVVYELTVENNRLNMKCNYQLIGQLVPVYHNYFRKEKGTIRVMFSETENHSVNGFVLSTRRAKGFNFTKIE